MAASEESTGEKTRENLRIYDGRYFLCQRKQYTVSLKVDGLQLRPVTKGKPR